MVFPGAVAEPGPAGAPESCEPCRLQRVCRHKQPGVFVCLCRGRNRAVPQTPGVSFKGGLSCFPLLRPASWSAPRRAAPLPWRSARGVRLRAHGGDSREQRCKSNTSREGTSRTAVSGKQLLVGGGEGAWRALLPPRIFYFCKWKEASLQQTSWEGRARARAKRLFLQLLGSLHQTFSCAWTPLFPV